MKHRRTLDAWTWKATSIPDIRNTSLDELRLKIVRHYTEMSSAMVDGDFNNKTKP